MPDELWMEVHDIVQEAVIKTMPKKKKYKKAKWLSEEALQIAEKRREAKGKGKIPKVMLKILQARLQLHVNRELPDVQAGFRQKQRNQRSNSQHPLDHGSSRKTSPSALLTMPKPLTGHNKLWKIFQEMGIPDHLICLLRNLYAGQEVTVRTGHGTTDWFQIRKGVCQGCILSLCLFNLYV